MSLIRWSIKHSRGGVEDSARELALAGEPEGTVVTRTSGGATLEFSVILRPPPDSKPRLLRLVAAFCTSEGIRKDTGIITWIRWPDRVVVEREVVGSTWVTYGPETDPAWVIVTSRVNNGAVKGEGITSLQSVLGTRVDDQLLMEKILESLAWMYYGFSRGMHPHIMKRVRSMMDTIGRRVEVCREGRFVTGTVRDVDERGRLVLKLDGVQKSLRLEPGESFKEL